MSLTPIEDDILFEFIDHVTSKGYFREKTHGGIILAQTQLTAAQNSGNLRIGTIVSVGPKCSSEMIPGKQILIDALKWTPQFEVEGKTMWKTNEQFVLGIVE